MLQFRLPLLMALCAGPCVAADDSVPTGWFASGWPAALADAACDDDSACLDKLRSCGPQATDCAAGVSYCSLTRAGTLVYETACQTDRSNDSVTAYVPSRTVVRMQFGTAPALDGAEASVAEDDCLYRADTKETFCARPITQEHTLRAWVKEE